VNSLADFLQAKLLLLWKRILPDSSFKGGESQTSLVSF